MAESADINTEAADALKYRCSKCRFRVAWDYDAAIAEADSYCANPETQRIGLGILNALWKQIKELYEHNILTYAAHKEIERRIKIDIERIQDYGIPLNTPYNQKCFAVKEAVDG